MPVHKPSGKELVFFFLCGILLSFPNALVFEQFASFLPYALVVIVVAPFVEEFAKVLPIFYRHGESERSLVTIGALIGLGFGICELFIYVVVAGVPLIDRIPGVVFHASSASITAYGIAKKNPLPYYLMSATLHMANNFFAAAAPTTFGVWPELLVVVAAFSVAWLFYSWASEDKVVN